MGDWDADHDFGWTVEETGILAARIADADLVASADSVRAYLDGVRNQQPPAGPVEKADLADEHRYLVVAEAKKRTGAGTAFLDLIAAGEAGLARAAEKYDPASGCPFDTYARWWICRALEI